MESIDQPVPPFFLHLIMPKVIAVLRRNMIGSGMPGLQFYNVHPDRPRLLISVGAIQSVKGKDG